MNGERIAFENWLGIKPCGAAHDLAWSAWQARASLPAPQQATPEPLIVKGAMAGMVDAQVRNLWPTKGATPEPVGEPAFWVLTKQLQQRETTTRGYMWFSNPQNDCWTPVFTHPAPGVPEGWTDADADAARLAMELECLLLDTKDTAAVSRWWKSANEALDLHRARLAAAQAKGD